MTRECFHAPPKQLKELMYRRALCGAGLGSNFKEIKEIKNGKSQECTQQNRSNRRLGSSRMSGDSRNLLKEIKNGF